MTIDELRFSFEKEFLEFIAENYPKHLGILQEACAYALSTPGKRVRPVFLALVAQSYSTSQASWIPPAIAVEMIHAYSLVHDDLPAMDNDDFRRGKPSTHKRYGEDFGILAGDALLTDAFLLLSQNRELSSEIKIAMIQELAEASGSRGMVQGQSLDIYFTKKELTKDSWSILETMHRKKTGALLGAACAMGALVSSAQEDIAIFRNFGELIGFAFQLRDDLLDTERGTGKSQGKDAEQQKLCSLRLKNPSEIQSLLERLTQDALSSVDVLSRRKNLRTEGLEKFTRELLTRKS